MNGLKNWTIFSIIVIGAVMFLLLSTGMIATAIPNGSPGDPYTSSTFVNDFFGMAFGLVFLFGCLGSPLLLFVAWMYK